MVEKQSFSIPEDLTWDGIVYDNYQIIIPSEIRDKLPAIKTGVKVKFGIIAIIEEKKKAILASQLMKKGEGDKSGKKTGK